jgi:hypothetical protein
VIAIYVVSGLLALAVGVKVARLAAVAKDLGGGAIPREGPLPMGTRLEVAEALKKAGVSMAELRPIIDARDDEELLRRYWEMKEEEEDA